MKKGNEEEMKKTRKKEKWKTENGIKKKKQFNKQAVNTKRETKERKCTNKEERCGKMNERKNEGNMWIK